MIARIQPRNAGLVFGISLVAENPAEESLLCMMKQSDIRVCSWGGTNQNLNEYINIEVKLRPYEAPETLAAE